MQSLYSNLVSYWNLQDQSGSRLDLTGTGNTLTNTNTVTSTDGIVGAASNFASASSQRLQIASNASIQGGARSYTWTCWVQLTTKPGSDMYILGKYSATAGQAEYSLSWNSAADKFVFVAYAAVDSGLSVASNTFGAPTTGVWYFVAVWYDFDALTINIDVNQTGVNNTGGLTAQAASSASLAIGALALIAATYWNGKICEVGRWNRVLTTQERAWLYNRGYGRTFPFDERYSRGLSRHGRSRRLSGITL